MRGSICAKFATAMAMLASRAALPPPKVAAAHAAIPLKSGKPQVLRKYRNSAMGRKTINKPISRPFFTEYSPHSPATGQST